MEESETGRPGGMNKGVVALLGVIVVLLVVIVAIILTQGDKTTTTNTATTETTATGSTTTSGGAMPPAATGVFDPTTATRLGKGVTPEQHVETYFKAVIAGDYTKAYDLLPADKKAAQDAESFGQQLAGYGITAYKLGKTTTSGDDTIVNATATMPGGDFEYVWTFTKVDGEWVVKSRELAGMGQ
ncbi:MAG: hypothetical protein ABFC80_04270 [Coriobacteriales bacterium]|nr:hypothetical protein [Actinomycetes bacterium]